MTIIIQTEKITQSKYLITIDKLQKGYGYAIGCIIKSYMYNFAPGNVLTNIQIFNNKKLIDLNQINEIGIQNSPKELISIIKSIKVSKAHIINLEIPKNSNKQIFLSDLKSSHIIQEKKDMVLFSVNNNMEDITIKFVFERGQGQTKSKDNHIHINNNHSPILICNLTVQEVLEEGKSQYDKLKINLNSYMKVDITQLFKKCLQYIEQELNLIYSKIELDQNNL